MLFIVAKVTGLIGEERVEDSQEPLIFPAEIATPGERSGCQSMVRNFCSQLYSPDARGNLRIGDSAQQYSTLQGQTQNDFDLAWFAFYKARLDNAAKLPPVLQQALARRDFFGKLRRLLRRPPVSKMRLDSKFEFEDLENEVDSIWDLAIDEAVSRRVERVFPGTFRLKQSEILPHVESQMSKARGKLWSEISLALWKGHPNWKLVETDFRELKEAFILAIDEFHVSDETKAAWKEKMASVRLALPGEDPTTANRECVSVARNAYYYRYLNTVTVCAGYFTGGAQILTLAHELAHAFDFMARLIDVHQASPLMQRLRNLRQNVCSSKAEFDCQVWEDFKTGYPPELESLLETKAEEPELHACLQKSVPSKALTHEVIREKSEEATKRRFSDFATSSAFFRLVNEQLKSPSGARIKNPSYLNPCASEIWNTGKFALDSEFVSLLLFTSAYRCSAGEGTERLRQAIIESKEISEKILDVVIEEEGALSARDDLQIEGYSSPSTERFADRIGSYAVAKYLAKFPTVERKRAAYLASSYWLCDRPSLKTENYEDFEALHDFILDRGVHPESNSRIVDWLSPPVVTALECQSDFEERSCQALEGN